MISFRPDAYTVRRRSGAFALIVVLLILGMLVVVAVGFLSSMTSERATANAFSSKAKADGAAQAGVDNAIGLLQQSFRDFPDSATVWETQGTTSGTGSSTNNEGTSLYVRAIPSQADSTQPDPSTDNRPLNPAAKQIFVRPLVSGAKFMPIATKSQAINGGGALATTDDKSVDVNVRRSATDSQGFIGTPPGYVDPSTPNTPKPKPFRVPWVDVKEQDVTDTTKARTIARYAFWVEDESFKTNVNYAGIGDPSTSATSAGPFNRRDNNKDVAPGPTDLDLFTMMHVLIPDGSQDPVLKTFAQNVYNLRSAYPSLLFPEPRAYLHDPDMTSTLGNPPSSTLQPTIGDRLRFLATANSGSLNLSRNGGQRLDLNSLIQTTTDADQIQAQVDRLVTAINYNLPKFGQRFYRNSATGDSATLNSDSTVTSAYAKIYPYKVAANIRDYIDTDTQPTLVKNNGLVPNPKVAFDAKYFFPPLFPWGTDGKAGDGVNLLWAQGKEATPFIQETVVRFRPLVTGNNFTVKIDYYVEFWNMSNHDIPASQMGNPFVRISSQLAWISAMSNNPPANTKFTTGVELTGSVITDPDGIGLGQADQPNRDYDIDLVNGVYQASGQGATPSPVSGVVFKAGAATVITTDPDFSQDQVGDLTRQSYSKSIFYYNKEYPSGTLNFPTTYYCSNLHGRPNAKGGKRVYNGTLPTGENAIGPVLRDANSSGSIQNYEDYETEVLMGNSQGYFDCNIANMPMGGGATFTLAPATPPTKPDHFRDYVNGGSLLGNSNTPSESGDPRTNNEQIKYLHFVQGGSVGQPDQSRYFAASSSDSPPFSLGLPNNLYLKPAVNSAVIANSTKTFYPWKDYFDFPLATYPSSNCTTDNAPSVIADSTLVSIGELGDIFDPARVLGTVGNLPTDTPSGTKAIEYSRGGGRTFKIGQHDDLIDPTPGSVSSNWASWRLTDIFSAGPTDGTVDDLYLPGRINLNGIARDNGTALLTALQGFVYQPLTSGASATASAGAYRVHGDGHKAYAPAGKTLLGAQKLIAELTARLTRTTPLNPSLSAGDTPSKETFGPLFERGELSELDILGKALPTVPNNPDNYPAQSNEDLIGNGGDLNRAFDHTREEFFRRMVEMICTRGNVFTAYVLGQAITQSDASSTKIVNSTSQLRVTFQLNPVWKTPNTNSDARNADGTPQAPGLADFDPGLGNSSTDAGKQTVAQRFAKPDHYEVQVLHVNNY